MRRCSTCGEEKDASDFYPSRPRKCRACCRAQVQRHRAAHADDLRERAATAYRGARAADVADRICEGCAGAIPEERQRGARFCSRECHYQTTLRRSREATLARRVGRLCLACGGDVPLDRSSRATTCSDKCRMALNEQEWNRRKCRSISHYALKVGRLIRQPCEVCGSEDVEMHHVDYFEPLNVRWLCFTHHRTTMHGQTVRKERV